MIKITLTCNKFSLEDNTVLIEGIDNITDITIVKQEDSIIEEDVPEITVIPVKRKKGAGKRIKLEFIYDDGSTKQFDSMTDAAEFYKTDVSTMSKSAAKGYFRNLIVKKV